MDIFIRTSRFDTEDDDILEEVNGAFIFNAASCPLPRPDWETMGDEKLELSGALQKTTQFVYAVNEGVAHLGWYFFKSVFTDFESAKKAATNLVDPEVSDASERAEKRVVTIRLHDVAEYFEEQEKLTIKGSGDPGMTSDIELG